MKVTYLHHSGFFVEMDAICLLFDYVQGTLPEIPEDKKLYVFVSHSHDDHFNSVIFELGRKHALTEYILSSDIELEATEYEDLKITYLAPYSHLAVGDPKGLQWNVTTLNSTDEGVAFLIEYQSQKIYYAGDLNRWVWPGESDNYNHVMATKYIREIKALKGLYLNLVFIPLDPRQEEEYAGGLLELMQIAQLKYVFPMHYWDKPEIMDRFKEEFPEEVAGIHFMECRQDQDTYEIEE